MAMRVHVARAATLMRIPDTVSHEAPLGNHIGTDGLRNSGRYAILLRVWPGGPPESVLR